MKNAKKIKKVAVSEEARLSPSSIGTSKLEGRDAVLASVKKTMSNCGTVTTKMRLEIHDCDKQCESRM